MYLFANIRTKIQNFTQQSIITPLQLIVISKTNGRIRIKNRSKSIKLEILLLYLQ